MSLASSYPRCELELRRSRRLLLYSFLLAATAAIAPWCFSISAPVSLVFNLALLPAALRQFRWARGELRRIAWQSDGRWVLLDREGREHDEARLLPGIFVGNRVLALRWRCISCRRKFRVVLLAGNCDAHERRRLAVRLRLTSDEELFRRGDERQRLSK